MGEALALAVMLVAGISLGIMVWRVRREGDEDA